MTDATIADQLYAGLVWETTDYGMRAETMVEGAYYLIVASTIPSERFSWQSPFDVGDWSEVESLEAAKAAAAADYAVIVEREAENVAAWGRGFRRA